MYTVEGHMSQEPEHYNGSFSAVLLSESTIGRRETVGTCNVHGLGRGATHLQSEAIWQISAQGLKCAGISLCRHNLN